ncbi:hypothetical protein [Micavibrio aeruginosavorus]|uniref:Lipoprotein n=1 Tax=Micavibrio aeruginosavorus EPB TaxID=349215 RepID=M4VWX4_9BACT|nr:hypothetical protein [Micavibrio aeruginosavorus]AGH97704.1 hypothetical protein A11S_882 [Micavibrio aeruginosavorus EPB]
MMRWAAGLVLSAAFAVQAAPAPDQSILTGQVECIPKAQGEPFLRDVMKEAPTGETGENALFFVEIWANKDKGSWTLIGTPKNPMIVGPNIEGEALCALDAGTGGYPDDVYMKYRDYFPKP